jgi:uncharacterized protein
MRQNCAILAKKSVLSIIKLYQKTLSPDHGFLAHRHPYGYCRFRPTCSDYTYQAVERYGVIKGGFMGIKRILRCNPFNKGGFDPVV